MAPPKSNEKKIRQLCEMGCSRAAAKSALRASKWDFEEAASAVWDDKHADAADVPTDDDEDDQLQSTSQHSLPAASLLASAASSSVHSPSTSALGAAVPESASSAKGKGRAHEPGESGSASTRARKLPTPAADASDAEMDDAADGQDDDDDNEDMASYSDADIDDYDGGAGGAVLDDENDGDDLESQAGSVDYGDGDAYGFLDISKDRKETIKEVEEPVKKVVVSQTKRGEFADTASAPDLVEAELFGFQRWISGCPEGNEQQQLFSLYTDLSGEAFVPAKCPHNCGSLVPHSASDFFAIPANADFFSYITRLAAVVQAQCAKCKGGICLACNEARAVISVEPATVKRDGAPEVLLHCPNLQALILGVGLFIAEQLWSGENAADRQESAASGSKKRKAGSPDVDSATSTVSASSYEYARSRAAPYKGGTGYGGARGNESDAGVKTALKAQQEKDKALASHLALVRVYLPNRDRPGPFRHSDHMPAGQTLAHLRRRFNPIASQLLSAESLSDMSERKELYTEFMAWLEVMSAHENLAGLMGQPIMRVASVTYSEAASASRGREKVIVFEASVGPRELLEKILAQVKIAQKVSLAAKARELALQGANGQGANGLAATGTSTTTPLYTDNAAGSSAATAGAQEAGRLMEFCETIIKAVGKIDRALKQSKRGEAVLKTLRVDVNGGNSTKKNKGEGASDGEAEDGSTGSTMYEDLTNVSDDQLKKVYVEWASETRYAEYNWEVQAAEGASTSELGPSYKHTYSKEAKSISSYPARNVAIMKEHTALAHNLPVNWDSSVFLRGDAGRPDVLKALITGPDGTPYENGCFIFDILLGGDYNQGPPNVSCKTTKGDRYRLNPNLYACGKVCLSLLGTWAGPGWVPGKSTLLQVLVSIQSMILWAEPITNEPSFEHDLGSARSKSYNFNVRRMVVHIAMLDYLRSPPEGFEEIILQHFRLKSRAICAQLDKWVAEDDGGALHHDSMNAIRDYRGSSAGAAASATAASQAGGTSSAAGAAFRADVEAVKGFLVRLEKGEDIFAKDAAAAAAVVSSSSASVGTKKAKTKAKK